MGDALLFQRSNQEFYIAIADERVETATQIEITVEQTVGRLAVS